MVDINWAINNIKSNNKCNKDGVYYRLRNKKEIDWIDLSVLPEKIYKNKRCVSWENSFGFKVKFKVGDLIGYLTLGRFNKENREIEVHYKDREEYISVSSIQNVYIKKLVSDDYNYIYNIGDIINDSVTVVGFSKNKSGNIGYIVQSLMYPDAPEYFVAQYQFKLGYTDAYKEGRKVYEGNSLYKLKHLRRYLIDIEEAKIIAPKSNKKIKVKCPECDKEKVIITRNLVNQGFNCPTCSIGISYPEKLFASYLEVKNISFESQKIFNSLPHRRFDFYLEDFNCVVEVNGEQHTRVSSYSTWSESYQKSIESDEEKKQFCKDNGIDIHFIDAYKSEFKYIVNNIPYNSYFTKLNDQEENEMLELIEKKYRGYKLETIKKMREEGIRLDEIGKVFGVTGNTISNILRKNNVETSRRSDSIKVKCVETGETFDSLREGANWCNIKSADKIRISCLNPKRSAGRHPVTGKLIKWSFA